MPLTEEEKAEILKLAEEKAKAAAKAKAKDTAKRKSKEIAARTKHTPSITAEEKETFTTELKTVSEKVTGLESKIGKQTTQKKVDQTTEEKPFKFPWEEKEEGE